MEVKLSVIIVNYNVRYFLEQALLSVRRAARRMEAEVWVVDNNSVDDSVRMVREKFPEVKLIANTDNPGFAIANNQAIRQSAGEYVLLLNPDTVVEEDTFEKCVQFMDANPLAGGLGVRMIDGAGKFLPESKRGFPSPWVAFCKSFGLGRLFPNSRLFNYYHLGFLPEGETHPVDVLAGAFMWLRRSVLDEVGLLDETFFMYGEDIDLSYRIIQAGFQNYYLPETTIIHYKGESTKKGSLNYVRAFYQAMIIFARKHFRGQKALVFVAMLQMVIYLRAGLTLLGNWWRRLYFPLLDAGLIYLGLVFLKSFWANYHFHDPDYYATDILYLNFPLYVLIWVAGIYFNGGYDEPYRLRRLFRGLALGTLLLAAVYGFLDLAYRSSRVLILLGAAWALGATVFLRLGVYFLRYRSFRLDNEQRRRLILVGSQAESERALRLLQKAAVTNNYLGRVAPNPEHHDADCLSRVEQLAEVVRIYRVDEIIFCSRDLSAQAIMQWMSQLGPHILYKILPEDSLSIIGSHSKNSPGELYTIDIEFRIAQPLHRRNKRLLDLSLAGFLLLTWPLQALFVRQPAGLLRNAFAVLLGRQTWVAYTPTLAASRLLPALRPGVLSPELSLPSTLTDEATRQRLNLFYAKDYALGSDLDIIWRGWRELGRGHTTDSAEG